MRHLRDALRETLPEYMLPNSISLLDALPLTPNGKLDRQALPAPDDSGLLQQTYVAPQGELEQALAQIWQHVLMVKRVGRLDNFFDLGGHSLLTIQLVEQLRQRGWTLPVQRIFTHPVLADLAQHVSTQNNTGFSPPENRITAQTTRITPALLPLFDLQDA